jgi:hypothetical protein
MVRRSRSALQEELLRLLQPPVPQRAGLLSERVAPVLAEIASRLAGRPVDEVVVALESAICDAGGAPDLRALEEFAEQIQAGDNPFA